MNKKAAIMLIILLLLVIAGLIYITNVYKIDSEIPTINSNLNKGNEQYNQAVLSLNNRQYLDAQKKFNESLKYYSIAGDKTATALQIAENKEDEILVEYLNATLTEINIKINAVNEINEGINVRDYSSSSAYTHYTNSNKLLQNITQYSDKRSQLEQQHPEKFISG
jgi:signal recognition particle GTPase